jgi:hypothetical protein
MSKSRDDREVRGAHPGWGVRFSDGTWLGGAHGWFRTEDAFYADTYDTKEEGEKYLKYVREDQHDKEYFSLDAEVVPAWEILAEHLRLEISNLRRGAKIDFYDLHSAVEDIQNSLDTVKDMVKY